MAGQLTQRWTQSVWGQAATLVADGPFDTPVDRPGRPRQHQVRLQREQVDNLVERYQSGLSVNEVAKEFNINTQTATRHLNRRGIKSPNHYRIPESRQAELLQLKAQGLNTADIGEHFGCSRSSVQRALRRAARSSLSS
ncbi:helix-turn-helix domain-containing protein [Nocardioides acrostichi]|uniref:Helix-turn-helix domain-containing protein n=1 Tax=Nocardioides acrostichi TaxID=2784339 RepID=A0A930V2L5_9ACTN|nr:helix-turn-helix domain-containing protein [Nocardioides acrostichi]MBF4163525.1 helix-turn-helix domain-containing protein [Nocardioides acrostichi]